MNNEKFGPFDLISTRDLEEAAKLYLAGHRLIGTSFVPPERTNLAIGVHFTFHIKANHELLKKMKGRTFKDSVEELLFEVKEDSVNDYLNYLDFEFTDGVKCYYLPIQGGKIFVRGELIKLPVPRLAF